MAARTSFRKPPFTSRVRSLLHAWSQEVAFWAACAVGKHYHEPPSPIRGPVIR